MKSEVLIKSVAIELNTGGVSPARVHELSLRERLAAYIELTKPRITFLIVLSSCAKWRGYCGQGVWPR